MRSSYASQILLVALSNCCEIVWDCVHDNCYCFLSKYGIYFFDNGSMETTVSLRWFLGRGIKWIRDREQTERTKSSTHVYLSHSLRRGRVCAADPLLKIAWVREWLWHSARRHRMWHSSKWALITRTNKTLSFHLYRPNNFHILDWTHPESHFL